MIEADQLKEKVLKLRDKINSVFKDIDGAGLSNDYHAQLDETQNADLKKKFERVERIKSANDSYIYYGQINAKGQMHGLGAMLFKNGFCY